MRHLSIAFVVLLLIAGCGGGSELSASDYRAKLDDACAKLAETNGALPERMRDEKLTIAEARQIADDAGRDFLSTVEDLDPPADLADAHQRLIDQGQGDLPSNDDPAALRRWLLQFADTYRDLGATGCEQRQRESAKQVPAAT